MRHRWAVGLRPVPGVRDHPRCLRVDRRWWLL